MEIQKAKDLQKCLLIMINKPEDEKKLERLLSNLSLPIIYQFRGHGTASSELLDICGLDGTLRLVTLCPVCRQSLGLILERASAELHLDRRGHGIAAVLRLTGLQDTIKRILDEEGPKAPMTKGQAEGTENDKEGNKDMSYTENTHSMILVAANQGYSEDIVEAARSGGAMGGTIIRGRRSGTESAMTLLGMSAQDEQELLLIIVEKEKRAAVMSAISSACGIKTPAHGIVLSLPVEAATGLAGSV